MMVPRIFFFWVLTSKVWPTYQWWPCGSFSGWRRCPNVPGTEDTVDRTPRSVSDSQSIILCPIWPPMSFWLFFEISHTYHIWFMIRITHWAKVWLRSSSKLISNTTNHPPKHQTQYQIHRSTMSFWTVLDIQIFFVDSDRPDMSDILTSTWRSFFWLARSHHLDGKIDFQSFFF